MPLFTQARGRGILRSSCVASLYSIGLRLLWRTASVVGLHCLSAYIADDSERGEGITIRFQARTDGLRLLRAINDTQTHGQEGVKADPSRAANEAGLEVGSERYQGAMAYLIEEAALLGDEHTSIEDEGEQHAHGYASYFFTRRAKKLLEVR